MTTPVLPRIRDYIHTNPNLVNDANGYVWVKHRDPKINRCDEIEGLQEISDKETCLTVATGFLSNEFQSLGFGPGVVGTPFLWAGGDTNVAHLPVGCSVPTDGVGRLNTRDIHYQTSTGNSGTTYSNGGRFDLKFCKRTPPPVVAATITTPPPVVAATITTPPPVVAATITTPPPVVAAIVVTPESDDDDDESDNKNMYYQIGGGISLCVFFIILLIIMTKK
jgi:hypothetical protein